LSTRNGSVLGFALVGVGLLSSIGGCRRPPEPEGGQSSIKARAALQGVTGVPDGRAVPEVSKRRSLEPVARTVATDPNLLVAFLGDQGNDVNADRVLELIKSEGAQAVVHNGDFDYVEKPRDFEARINRILGQNYPYFSVVGNHDAPKWTGPEGYAKLLEARLYRVPEMKCSGEPGVRATCSFRGLMLVESCIGVDELGDRCDKDSPEQLAFIRDALAESSSMWTLCNWHKNQRDMQVGGKADEVGWGAYQACQEAGALILTGHEHSYSRTLTLTQIGQESAAHGKTGEYSSIDLFPGRTAAVVSGLGGVGLRSFADSLHDDDTWWSSYATDDRWVMHGKKQQGVSDYGALFIRFHVDGDPKKASAYFKDVRGRVLDTFTIRTR
jgi:Calcineurin-like phosphoesterase